MSFFAKITIHFSSKSSRCKTMLPYKCKTWYQYYQCDGLNRGEVTGICGDCNGNVEDDLNTADGEPTSGAYNARDAEVGNSYEVADPENLQT